MDRDVKDFISLTNNRQIKYLKSLLNNSIKLKREISYLFAEKLDKELTNHQYNLILEYIKTKEVKEGMDALLEYLYNDPALLKRIKFGLENNDTGNKFITLITDSYEESTGDYVEDKDELIRELSDRLNIRIKDIKEEKVDLTSINNEILNVMDNISLDIEYLNIDKDKKVELQCIDKIKEISIQDYVYAFYQVFSGSGHVQNVDFLNDNIFSTLLYAIGEKDYKEYASEHSILPIIFKDRNIIYEDRSYFRNEKNIFMFGEMICDNIDGQFQYGNIALLPLSISLQEGDHQIGAIIENGDGEISIALYNPHGTITKLTQVIVFFEAIKPYMANRYNKRILLLANEDVSQYLSIQGKISLPFCVMYTYLWFYVFYNTYKRINKPMKYWITSVEKISTDYILRKGDPENYIVKFSYYTIENMIKYISTHYSVPQSYIDKGVNKIKGISRYDIELLREDDTELAMEHLIKIFICLFLKDKEDIRNGEECSSNIECNEDELCLDRKCISSPTYENIFLLRDNRSNPILNTETIEKVLTLLREKGMEPLIDADYNIITYSSSPYEGIKRINLGNYYISHQKTIKYTRDIDNTREEEL